MKKVLALVLVLAMVLPCIALADMTAGTYEASAQGYKGPVKLTVTIEADKITAIEMEHSETEGLGSTALETLRDEVLEHQTIGIDTITSATYSSIAFKNAMTEILTKAGADMDKMTAPVAAGEQTQETLTTDIVVVGGGAAGLTAGIKALQSGAKVILLEKTPLTGGASAMAGAGTKATGSKWSIESGSTETAEDFIAQITANGHYQNDMPTVENFARTLGTAFDWLVAEDGANIPYTRKEGTPSASFSGTGRGAGVTKNLTAKFEAEGGVLMLSTPATELIIENGAVVGVKAESKETIYTINAQAVILASGGYGANKDLVPDSYEVFVYAGHAGATGDAIKMVEPLNADLIKMDLINTQPNSMILPSGLGQYCNPGVSKAYAAGGFMVNEDGVRFVNEVASAWDIMQEMKKNEFQFLVMDQAAFDGFNAGMTGSNIYTMENVAEWLQEDYAGQPVLKTAATLEELAAKLGVPADAVVAAAESFNTVAATQGQDEFGRTIKVAQNTEGPYYAMQMHIRYYASLGGLHVNDDMQVLNTNQEAIPNLYAAGEVIGGHQGDVYMGGCLFAYAICSGHNAGAAAAAAIAK